MLLILFQLWDVAVGMNHLHTMDPFIGHYCLCPSVVQVSNLLLYCSILNCVEIQVYETATRWRARIGYYVSGRGWWSWLLLLYPVGDDTSSEQQCHTHIIC